MANILKHKFTSGALDSADSSLVRPSNWNEEHGFAGGWAGAPLTFDPAQTDGVSWSNMIKPQSASAVGLVIQGLASQTGDLLRLQDNAGTNLVRVTAGGGMGVGLGANLPGFILDVGNRIRLRDGGGADTAGLWLYQGGVDQAFIGMLGTTGVGFWTPTAGWSLQMNVGDGKVGIGGYPGASAMLKVTGQIEVTGGSPASGKVLTSDTTGLATWQAAPVTSVFGRTGAVVAASGDYSIGQISGAVTSVFGRTGAVYAQAGDYSIGQISHAVTGVFNRIGSVQAQIGDYTAAQVTNAAATNTINIFTQAQVMSEAVYFGTASVPGRLEIGGSLGSDSGGHRLTSQSVSGTKIFALPAALGNSGEQLTNNGSGQLYWAAPSCLEKDKHLLGLADKDSALQQLLNTTVHRFRYRDGKGTNDLDTVYVGPMAKDAPWAMHYGQTADGRSGYGTVVNPVNTLGYLILGVQALHERLALLERR